MFFDKSRRGFDNKYMNIGIALVTYVHPLWHLHMRCIGILDAMRHLKTMRERERERERDALNLVNEIYDTSKFLRN